MLSAVIALEMLTAGAREMVGEAMIVRIFVVSACEASDAAARAAEPMPTLDQNSFLAVGRVDPSTVALVSGDAASVP